jgi:hypothetical protein
MKKTHLFLISLLSISLLIVYSCRNDIKDIVYDRPSVSSPAVEGAKIFLATHKTNTGIPLKAYWKDSWTMKTSFGQLLIVPAPENPLDNANNSVRRVFIYASSHNRVLTGRIIEFWGNKYNVTANLNKLISDYYLNVPTQSFSGRIYEYTLDYAPIKGAVFEDGKMLNVRSSLVNVKAGKLSTQASASKSKLKVNSTDDVIFTPDPNMPDITTVPSNCTVQYATDYVYSQGSSGGYVGEPRLTEIKEVYLGTTCKYPTSTVSGASGGNESSGDSSGEIVNNPSYGFGFLSGALFANTSGNFMSYDIRPNTNLCVGEILGKIKYYAQIYNNIAQGFGIPGNDRSTVVLQMVVDAANFPNHRLVFKQEPNMVDRDGHMVFANSKPQGITFNDDYLNTATNLSVAATAIHEIVHTYFLWNLQDGTVPANQSSEIYQEFLAENEVLYKDGRGGDGDVQHNLMGEKYQYAIATMLLGYAVGEGITSPDPNRTLQQYCQDLAWSGLTETSAFTSKSGAEKERILKVINNEKDPSTITNHSDHATAKMDCH